MFADAVVLESPGQLALASLPLTAPGPQDITVAIARSGISTGTEKLFYTGEMPPFPGMGYPLVPGYEAAGEVVEAGRDSGYKPGDHVFVPGAACFEGAHGLFGGAAETLITRADRVTRIDAGSGEAGALLALAATARHALAGYTATLPELIVGHGVLGRLLARLTIAAGGAAPTVWEIAPERMAGGTDYAVMRPEDDPRRDYASIYDASGQGALLNDLIGRLARGGEIVLAGFYAQPLSFAFPPAFMKEARLRVAAEWSHDDLTATRGLIETGALSLDGLVTHRSSRRDVTAAYETAFTDPACLKMIIDWKDAA